MKVVKVLLKVFAVLLVLAGSVSGYLYYLLQTEVVQAPIEELSSFTGSHIAYPFSIEGGLSLGETDSTQAYKAILASSIRKDSAFNRQTVSLNGEWEIEEGNSEEIPSSFSHKVQVPGFAKMAEPAFEDGQTEDAWETSWGYILSSLPGQLFPSRFMKTPRFKDELREAFWYRKTFKIEEGTAKEYAQLKIGRAQFGSEAWLNGKKLGGSSRNFTPTYYDVTGILKESGEENELIVKVGTSVGHDYKNAYTEAIEKRYHYPGIYDNVELFLTGDLLIKNIQIVPNINDQKVKVVGWVRNLSDSVKNDQIEVWVSTSQGGIKAAARTDSMRFEPKTTSLFSIELPMQNPKLWSPEHPDLYSLTVQVTGDQFQDRFGMRDFHFDAESRAPILNNKPYYLRGTSIPYFRFIETPGAMDHCFDKEWIRKVYQQFKAQNWNHVRFHIGNAPSIWYDVADEEGIIVQDEYAIWTYKTFRSGIPLDTLVAEYVNWMEDQWNHASVLIWDAQNESETFVEPRTAAAIQLVRGLDLSNRPWDNGWGLPGRDTDPQESHPYIGMESFWDTPWSPLLPYSGLDALNDSDPSQPYTGKFGNNPVLVNEHVWRWLDKEGNPTDYTRAGYDKWLPNSTPEERWEFYAYEIAASTEHKRAMRAAGVSHFAGLTSNYADSKTSDIFLGLDSLEVIPQLAEAFKHCYNPVGICIFDWTSKRDTGENVQLPVVLVNDTYETWQGSVKVSLQKEGKEIDSQAVPAQVGATGKSLLQFSFALPKVDTGDYAFLAELITAGEEGEEPADIIQSRRRFQLVGASQD